MVKCPLCGYAPKRTIEKLYKSSHQQLPKEIEVMQWHYWGCHPKKSFEEDFNVPKMCKETEKSRRQNKGS